jgi:hypothetical protein
VKGFKESVSQDSADENTDDSADAKAEQHGDTEQSKD